MIVTAFIFVVTNLYYAQNLPCHAMRIADASLIGTKPTTTAFARNKSTQRKKLNLSVYASAYLIYPYMPLQTWFQSHNLVLILVLPMSYITVVPPSPTAISCKSHWWMKPMIMITGLTIISSPTMVPPTTCPYPPVRYIIRVVGLYPLW